MAPPQTADYGGARPGTGFRAKGEGEALGEGSNQAKGAGEAPGEVELSMNCLCVELEVSPLLAVEITCPVNT